MFGGACVPTTRRALLSEKNARRKVNFRGQQTDRLAVLLTAGVDLHMSVRLV